jgi:integrase
MPRYRDGPAWNKQNKIYYFDSWVGFPPARKRVRYSLKTKDPAKARYLWERAWRKEWAAYWGEGPRDKRTPVSFVEFGKEFVAYERDIRHMQEWKTVKARLNFILDIWGDVRLDQVEAGHLNELDKHLRETERSSCTINHYFKLLKQFFKYAIDQGRLSGTNPIAQFNPYIIDEKGRAYTQDEIARILDAARRVEEEARPIAGLQKLARRIVLLLLYTGMRGGEVLNLRWDNIKEDRIVLKRTETKQKREKVVPITAEVAKILDEMREKRKDDFVLPLRRKGGKMTPGFMNGVSDKIRRLSGIADFRFHNLRHTAATIMVSEALGHGVGLADVMKVLGHSKIETTARYQHPEFGRMKKAVESIAEKVERKAGTVKG